MDEIDRVYNLPIRERYFTLKDLFSEGKMSIVRAVGRKIRQSRQSKLGNWEAAKNTVENMVEPNLNFYAKREKHYWLELPEIEGFRCQYMRHITSSGRKDKVVSWINISNPDNNTSYFKFFAEVTNQEAEDIFNS